MIIKIKNASYTYTLGDLNSWWITTNLVGVTSSNSTSLVTKGQSYSTRFTIGTGYTLDPANVSVKMGSTPISLNWSSYTEGGYADLNIESVNADVTITIVATGSGTPPSGGDTKYTLTVNPAPSTATVKLNGVVQKSITVNANAVVTYEVSASGYVTQSGSWTVTQTETKNVSLVASGGETPPSGGDTEILLTGEYFAGKVGQISDTGFSTGNSDKWDYAKYTLDGTYSKIRVKTTFKITGYRAVIFAKGKPAVLVGEYIPDGASSEVVDVDTILTIPADADKVYVNTRTDADEYVHEVYGIK